MDYSCIFNQRAQSYINASVNWPTVRKHEFVAYLDVLNLKPGERFLDVPCGTGIIAALIDDRVNYSGLDPSGPFVAHCQAQGIPVVKASMRTTGLPDASFDVIGSLTGIHHEAQRAEIYSEWYRLLRPGGRLLLMDVWKGSSSDAFLNGFVHAWSSHGHSGDFVQDADLHALRDEGFVDLAVRQIDYHWCAPSEVAMHDFMQDLFGLDRQPGLSLMLQAWRQLGWQQAVEACRIPWTLAAVSALKPGGQLYD